MLGIRFMKAAPTTYLIHFKGGRAKREGAGLSFFYYAPTSTIVAVPVASADLPFAFSETTADFQAVTIQGQITWRVVDPKRLAALLDFTLDAKGEYLGEGFDVLTQRLLDAAQVLTQGQAGRMALRQALVSQDEIAARVLEALRASEPVALLGVEILGLSILSVKPTPEMSRALEAEAREGLKRKADEAIYARRNSAVLQERMIKESELATEIAVELKKREIRETQMAADIGVEEKRTVLIEKRSENEKKDADARAYTLEASLKPVRDMDWKTLMAIFAKGADPRLMIALAFRELAENAQKIGELNISPDLLRALIDAPGAGKGKAA
ncbi:SPFH domain-containing protein [bacterium]|nr:SPFH domain-containing protein [bacterium]